MVRAGAPGARTPPRTRDRLELAIDLRFNLRSALAPFGELATILRCLRECESLAEALGDRQRLGRAFAYLIESFWSIGDHARAIEVGERALAIAEEVGDFPVEAVTIHSLGRVYHTIGAYRKATELLRRNVTCLGGDLRYEHFGQPMLTSVNARGWLVACLAELGEFFEGLIIAEDALRIAETVGHPPNLVSAHLYLGLLRLQKGEVDTATAALECSFGIVQGWSISVWFHIVASPLGFAYALAGHLDKALPLLEHAVQDAGSRGRVERHSLRIARLGEGYLLAGRLDDAITLSQRALDLSLKHAERGNQALARRLLGEIAAHHDPPHVENARDHYGQALTLADELGMRPLVAHCQLGLGKLYRRTRKHEQAHQHLTTATTMYRELDMGFWVEKTEAEMSGDERL